MSFSDKALSALDRKEFQHAIVYAILSLGESGLEPLAQAAAEFVDGPSPDNFKRLAEKVQEIVG